MTSSGHTGPTSVIYRY